MQDELSRVIAMDLWVAAKKKSLQELRNKQTEVEFLEGALTQLQQQKFEIEKKVSLLGSQTRNFYISQMIFTRKVLKSG